MSQLNDAVPNKISVWIGTTNKSHEDFNAYYVGLEDPDSGCGLHKDLGTDFIDTDWFCSFGTASRKILPVQLLCAQLGCSSKTTELKIVEKCLSMGISTGNVLSCYRHASFVPDEPRRLYNDMWFIGSFDDPIQEHSGSAY